MMLIAVGSASLALKLFGFERAATAEVGSRGGAATGATGHDARLGWYQFGGDGADPEAGADASTDVGK